MLKSLCTFRISHQSIQIGCILVIEEYLISKEELCTFLLFDNVKITNTTTNNNDSKIYFED